MIEIISHRGARFEAPENTLEGFQHAIDLGMTTVEFDVRLTRDLQLVVIHDATVDRTTNGTGTVSDLTLAEIQALDARSMHVLWPAPVRVPTLDAVLGLLTTMPNMEIEIKKDADERYELIVNQVVAALDRARRIHGVVITSFEAEPLRIAKSLRPDLLRGYIGDWSDDAMFDTATELEPYKAGINLRNATPEIVARAKATGYRTAGWPCNDEDSVRKVIACGFDEVCTDAPSVFAPLFGRAISQVG